MVLTQGDYQYPVMFVYRHNDVQQILRQSKLLSSTTLHRIAGSSIFQRQHGDSKTESQCTAGASNSNCSEGQWRLMKSRWPEGRIMTLTQQWRYLKSCTLVNISFISNFLPKVSFEFRQIVSSRLYVHLKGTCSLAGRALLNTGE